MRSIAVLIALPCVLLLSGCGGETGSPQTLHAAPEPADTYTEPLPPAPNALAEVEPAATDLEPEPALRRSDGLLAYPPPGPDLDCADIGAAVRVEGADPHRLDRDHDGVGCEEYR
ncbi:MAG TPA: excalibur calcium-binding domain-containing protein [Longimicrobium sp.]|nr:excalibur calcium-binding domain-containing protein [Longimicrobium sp.]